MTLADTKAEVFIVTFWSGGAHGAMFLVQISIVSAEPWRVVIVAIITSPCRPV
jgi:hypothetical protein